MTDQPSYRAHWHGPVWIENEGSGGGGWWACPGCGEIFPEGDEGGIREADPDAIRVADLAEPDSEIVAAFVAAMSEPVPVRWHYLAWGCIPGRDYADPPSLPGFLRSSRWRRCESARPRQLRACLRAHPSDGPPARRAARRRMPVLSP